MDMAVIPYEAVFTKLLQQRFKISILGRVAATFPGRFGHLALMIHRLFKPPSIQPDIVAAEHILGEIQRKAEGVVEFKGRLAAKDRFTPSQLLVKEFHAVF